MLFSFVPTNHNRCVVKGVLSSYTLILHTFNVCTCCMFVCVETTHLLKSTPQQDVYFWRHNTFISLKSYRNPQYIFLPKFALKVARNKSSSRSSIRVTWLSLRPRQLSGRSCAGIYRPHGNTQIHLV